MSTRAPNAEDLRKLHAEVNQITNQRFLITTSGLALFGVVGGWLIPRGPVAPGDRVSDFTCLTCTMLIVFLLILFWYSLQLKRMLRVLTTYLDVFGDSGWEQHWAAFRQRQRHFAYTKAQAIVFLVLGGLVMAYPLGLRWTLALEVEPNASYWSLQAMGAIYLGTVLMGGIFSWFDNEPATRKAWEEIKVLEEPNAGGGLPAPSPAVGVEAASAAKDSAAK